MGQYLIMALCRSTATRFLLPVYTVSSTRNVSNMLAELPEEHAALRKQVREFAQEELRPIADMLDKEKKFPWEQVKIMGDMGLMGMEIKEEYGGAGRDGLSYAIAMEEISRGCAGTGTIMTAHNSIFMGPIKGFGNEKQKSEILPQFVTGEKVGCFMLSEPGNGSDAGAASTNAKSKDGKWVLNGTKAWITNSYQSSGGSLFATTDRKLKHRGISCFYVPFDSPGLSLGAKETLPLSPLDYPFQLEQDMLAQMEVDVEAARLLTWQAASLKDLGKPIGKVAAMAKLYASEVATKVTHMAIQVMGEEGVVRGSGVERNYRDARITEIYEGTSEIQKVVIAGHMKNEYKAARMAVV